MSRPVLRVLQLGQRPWQSVLKVQEQLVATLKSDPSAPDTLILCEHPPIYTAGKRVPQNDAEEKRLRSLGADYHRVRMPVRAVTPSPALSPRGVVT